MENFNISDLSYFKQNVKSIVDTYFIDVEENDINVKEQQQEKQDAIISVDSIYNLFTSENDHKIFLEEWNEKTGLVVSLDDTLEIDKLNSLYGYDRGDLKISNEKCEIEIEIINQNKFYIYTQKIKEKIYKPYVIFRPFLI
jgi:hypothetical protein